MQYRPNICRYAEAGVPNSEISFHHIFVMRSFSQAPQRHYEIEADFAQMSLDISPNFGFIKKFRQSMKIKAEFHPNH